MITVHLRHLGGFFASYSQCGAALGLSFLILFFQDLFDFGILTGI